MTSLQSELHPIRKQFVIAGTGSRNLVLDEDKYNEVMIMIRGLLKVAKTVYGDNLLVISGMAEGFDEVLAGAAMIEKIKLLAAVPNVGYANYYWKDNSLLKLNRILPFNLLLEYAKSTGGVHYVCSGIYEGGRHSNFIRNEWMADQADLVWVYNPTTKGTAQCYGYCRLKNIETLIINIGENHEITTS